MTRSSSMTPICRCRSCARPKMSLSVMNKTRQICSQMYVEYYTTMILVSFSISIIIIIITRTLLPQSIANLAFALLLIDYLLLLFSVSPLFIYIHSFSASFYNKHPYVDKHRSKPSARRSIYPRLTSMKIINMNLW